MKLTNTLITALAVTSCAFSTHSNACTNFIIGKKASKDGSVFVTYSADDYGGYGALCHYSAGTHPKGTMRPVIDWESGELRGYIPEAPITYNVVGNMNEHQLTITETTFGGREELADSTGIIDYGSLEYITLQRARTAREAIQIMTSLVKQYGYASYGESFSIADPNEAWILEMVGKGPGKKGAVWAAIRIPDDCIAAHANQSRIDRLNFKDKKNCLYSPDVIKLAREKGYFNGKDAEFSFCDAYAPADFGARRYCEARVWSFFNRHKSGMNQYLDYILGIKENTTKMPLYVKPDHLLDVESLRQSMRDHYEGTPLDMTQDIGAGPYASPYRPTPLEFKVDGKTYFNERPSSTQQSSFVLIAQMRSFLPNALGIEWFGTDDANMVAFTPVYCCTTQVPHCYDEKTADGATFSWESSFWVCNWVANMVYPRYSAMIDDLRHTQTTLESNYDKAVMNNAEQWKSLPTDSMVTLCTQATQTYAQQMMTAWKNLGEYLIVKHNDQVVRKEKDGKFERTSTGLPARPIRKGFPEAYAKKYVEATGARYLVPEKKKE